MNKKSRDEIYDIYIEDFSSYKKVQIIKDPYYVTTDADVEKSINKTYQMYKDELDEIELTDIEKALVTNKIKARHAIFQEEGCAILGDYEHDRKWYENLLNQEDFEEYYWNRYKGYLIHQKHFPETVVETLEKKTLMSLMSYLGNPNENDTTFSTRGLVVGDVQSGKTSNYLGLIAKAADAGYQVIFVLTGTIESLRKQTQERVEEGFIGFDSVNGVDVGVTRGDKTPKSLTSRAKDFTGSGDQTTALKINNSSSEPMIFVIKKNVPVLKKLYSALKKINTSYQNQKIDYPILVIDDEADNASINTSKPDDDPTKINGLIRQILSLFTRSSYVAFTATPFANVFISYDNSDDMLGDDLFPKDFIYALNPPSNYCGSKTYFFEENNNVRYIKDYDESLFPMKHKKDWDGNRLFGSLYSAVNTFLLANVIRDKYDSNTTTHRSMLINMSRFTAVQFVIKDIVEEYFDKVKKQIKLASKYDPNYALKNPIVKAIKDTFDEEYSSIIRNGHIVSWEDVFPLLYDAIADIKVVVVNSSKNSQKLDYEAAESTGLRVIAIGGLALSRGLTLEGLCVSYFYRNTATFDVLMQMGRWFGYRDDYKDLCKIFITKTTADYYKYICESTDGLKSDIKTMCAQEKRPIDFGIRVLNDSVELGITAANKMRTTSSHIVRKSFYGNVFETPYLDKDVSVMENNVMSTLEFLNDIPKNKLDSSIRFPYFRNIDKDKVIDLLNRLKVHEANENFDVSQLIGFLHGENNLNLFDVLIIGGDSKKTFKSPKHAIELPLVKRAFDLKIMDDPIDDIVRISRQRARLGGKQDTKFGLSKEQCEEVERKFEKPKEQDYMLEGRNPLLIIYFIEPKNDISDEEKHTGNSDWVETEKYKNELEANQISFLVGFAIGVPTKFGAENEVKRYVVNKTVDYFKKDHEEFTGEDENE